MVKHAVTAAVLVGEVGALGDLVLQHQELVLQLFILQEEVQIYRILRINDLMFGCLRRILGARVAASHIGRAHSHRFGGLLLGRTGHDLRGLHGEVLSCRHGRRRNFYVFRN